MFHNTLCNPLSLHLRRQARLWGLTVLALAACSVDESPESQGDEADDSAIELRGGATLVLQPGTTLDRDELASREGYGATLTDDQGSPWFARVEAADDELLDELGLERLAVESAQVHVGVLDDVDGGDQCFVFMPFAPGSGLALSRPEGQAPCPLSAEELVEWLPEVRPGLIVSLRAAYGTVVGSFNGITAYSNGSTGYDSGSYSTCGLKWQCVEYVNRYYYQKLAHKNLKGTGNANNYYSTAGSKELTAYTNGSSVKPQVGDMLTSAGGTYGHIAIVRGVGTNYVNVIHQNWSNSASDASKSLTMTVSNGKYTVSGFSASYPVQGWLRKSSCTPTVSSVSPTSASLNTTTAFTVSGSCLPKTTTPWIANCANLVVTSTSATQVKFSCKPSYTTGSQSGVIKQGPDGTTLKNFNVSVF